MHGRNSSFSQVFAGQAVGIKEVHDDIWLLSFMDYDLGYFDLETRDFCVDGRAEERATLRHEWC